MAIQLAFEVAVHVQKLALDTVTAPLPPPAAIDWLFGEIE
jgi:hypothetical protein